MLSRNDRFRIVSAVAEELEDWSWHRTEALYLAFGIAPNTGYNQSAPEYLSSLDDDSLMDLSNAVLGGQPLVSASANAVLAPAAAGPWSTSGFKLFVSHSAEHKEECGAIAAALDRFGIEAFVAHDSMTVTRPWQTQIEDALRTMDALLALCHPPTIESAWCQQEIGWALGRGVPYFVIRMGCDPKAFISHQQWPSRLAATADEIADEVVRWASALPSFPQRAPETLIGELEISRSFDAAAETAKRLCQFQTLQPDQLDRISTARRTNVQLGGKNPIRELRNLYLQHGLRWTD